MMYRNLRAAMISGIAAAAALPRQLDGKDPPPCACETFINGMMLDKDGGYKPGTHACMRWHKNNPHLSHVVSEVEGLPEVPGDGKGYQVACSHTDKNIRHGLAEEFEEEWQGGCADDMAKCTIVDTEKELVRAKRERERAR